MKDIIQPGNMERYKAAIQAMVRQAQAVCPQTAQRGSQHERAKPIV